MGLFDKKEKTPAETVIEDVCRIRKDEKVLIIDLSNIKEGE